MGVRVATVEVIGGVSLLHPINALHKVTHRGLDHVPLSSYMQARDTR